MNVSQLKIYGTESGNMIEMYLKILNTLQNQQEQSDQAYCSICIIWMQYYCVKPNHSTFRTVSLLFEMSQFLNFFFFFQFKEILEFL